MIAVIESIPIYLIKWYLEKEEKYAKKTDTQQVKRNNFRRFTQCTIKSMEIKMVNW